MLLSLSWLHFLISIKIIKYICKRECECLCPRKFRLDSPFLCKCFLIILLAFSVDGSFWRAFSLALPILSQKILARTKVTDPDGLEDPSHL